MNRQQSNQTIKFYQMTRTRETFLWFQAKVSRWQFVDGSGAFDRYSSNKSTKEIDLLIEGKY